MSSTLCNAVHSYGSEAACGAWAIEQMQPIKKGYHWAASSVTPSGIQLLATGKPVERKVCFILEADNRGQGTDSCPEANSPLTSSRQTPLKVSFRGTQAEGGGSMQKQHHRLWQSSSIGHYLPDSVTLIVLSTVNLQFQNGSVCSHFSELSSWNWDGLCHGYSLWSSHSPPSRGFSIYKTAHRI